LHVSHRLDLKSWRVNTPDGKFGEYALDTARKLISLYPWYYLPPSVPKFVVHAPNVINYTLVPIEELSEEAAVKK